MPLPPALLKEIHSCGECHIFDPDNQPSVARALERGEEFDVWSLPNGMTLSVQSLGETLHLPLTSDFVLCGPHAERAEAECK